MRNNIKILGSDWNITVICKKYNYLEIKKIISIISENINLIKINNNENKNSLFINLNFWKKIKGENLLIIDNYILLTKNNFKNFLNNDFLVLNNFKNYSIRKKSILINVIKFVKNIENTFQDEIKFFTKRLDKYKLGNHTLLDDNILGKPINLKNEDLLCELNNNINFLIEYEEKFISIMELLNFNISVKKI